MLQDRRILEDNLSEAIGLIKHDKEKVDQIKSALMEYKLRPGITQKIFNNPQEELPEIDLRLMYLITKEVYSKSGKMNIRPEDYFTEFDIKNSKIYNAEVYEEDISMSFPITIDNVLMIDDENYLTVMDIKFIRSLMVNKLLRYNFDTQRDAKYVRRKESTERVANVYMPHVKEITKRLLQQDLSPTTLTFNALVGTADEGDELTYDAKKQQLTINKGVFLDILDGFHRISGFMNALDQYPDLDFTFQVAIKNYNLAQAQRHIAEINTYYKMNQSHKVYLEQTRYSDNVVKHLNRFSDLKGRISTGDHTHSLNDELVTSKTLSDTIDEVFKMSSKKDAQIVGEYLSDFFDYLLGTYKEEFVTNVEETREKSIINANSMFAGYIIIAKKMLDQNIKISKISSILGNIDFSRDNILWTKLGIIEDGIVSKQARKHIKNYFNKYEIETGVIQ
jgi:DNA-sulfur modification-associated